MMVIPSTRSEVISAGKWCNVILLVLVNAMWGAMYFANKWVDLGPIGISIWTFMIATPVLLPFLLWERWWSPGHRRLCPTCGTPRSDRRGFDPT